VAIGEGLLQEKASNTAFHEKVKDYIELWQSVQRDVMKIW
jgi:hypothetical protein